MEEEPTTIQTMPKVTTIPPKGPARAVSVDITTPRGSVIRDSLMAYGVPAARASY
jgi:hypothetical protein